MKKGHEEVSTNQARYRMGTPRETPTASSLVVAMYAEELRLYSQILPKISLEMLDDVATSTFREVDNAVYFTREQFPAGLHLPVPSLVKQFLHFTRAPPTLVHPNTFHILMGCSVLNSLYQLDISWVEICFNYTLKLGIGGCLSMSAYSPQLQFITGLPDSLKTKVKGVVLVKGLQYEILGPQRLPFNPN